MVVYGDEDRNHVQEVIGEWLGDPNLRFDERDAQKLCDNFMDVS